MKKYKILVVCMLGLYCQGEIPVYDRNKASEKNAKAWSKYYDSLPELKALSQNKTYPIRVKRVVDPRFEDLSDEKYMELYRQIENDVSYYLGYSISIREVGSEEILHFFRKNKSVLQKPEFQYLIGQHFLHLEKPEDQIRLKSTITDAAKSKPWDILARYLPATGIPRGDYSAAVDYFYKNFQEKYFQIGNIPVMNYKGFLRQGEYELTQHYTYWSAILYETREAEFFITNSIIAGADDQMPLYVINRGGITSALTENNRYNNLQGCIALTLMPFISNHKYFDFERGNIYENILVRVISMMAVHEFGHLLKRYDEYYNLPASVHNAPVDLHYQDWYQDIVNGKPGADQLRTLKKF